MSDAYLLPPDDSYDEYWAELGRFIHQFSEVERSAQSLLRHCAGMDDTMGAALFSGVKIDAALSQINRIFDTVGNAVGKARLKSAFDQLGTINGVRNNIVHWGARKTGDEEGLLVSNRYLAHTKERIREYRVSPANLRAMTRDLMKITFHFQWEEFTDEQRAKSQVFQRVVRPILDQPWWYKSPPQGAPTSKKPKTPQE